MRGPRNNPSLQLRNDIIHLIIPIEMSRGSFNFNNHKWPLPNARNTTIEFRGHEDTLDPDRIAALVAFEKAWFGMLLQ
jgi:hypothetical protein